MKKTTTGKKASAKKRIKASLQPKKSNEMLVTKKWLELAKAELESDITTARLEARERLETVALGLEQSRAENKFILNGFRSEVKSEIAVLRSESKSETAALQSEINGLRLAIHDLTAEFRSGFGKIESAVQTLVSEIHHVKALSEEQNAKFNFALDGYAAVDHRIDALENKLKDI